MDIPDIAEYVSKFKDLSNQEKDQALNLKTVVEAIKNQRDSYKEPVETKFDDVLV